MSVAEEACPLNLAPTASTTATLAHRRCAGGGAARSARLHAQDFARSHPGGALGRKLLLHVADVMRTGDDLPRVGPQVPLADGLVDMSKKGLGMCVVVEDGRMLGVFTDGDLRRVLDREVNVHKHDDARGHDLARQAVDAPASWPPKRRISWRSTASPPCPWSTTQGALVGALNVHDLLRAGVL